MSVSVPSTFPTLLLSNSLTPTHSSIGYIAPHFLPSFPSLPHMSMINAFTNNCTAPRPNTHRSLAPAFLTPAPVSTVRPLRLAAATPLCHSPSRAFRAAISPRATAQWPEPTCNPTTPSSSSSPSSSPLSPSSLPPPSSSLSSSSRARLRQQTRSLVSLLIVLPAQASGLALRNASAALFSIACDIAESLCHAVCFPHHELVALCLHLVVSLLLLTP